MKARRKALGLSMEALARQADVSLSFIHRIENLGDIPRADRLMRIAGALGTTVEDLFGADGKVA